MLNLLLITVFSSMFENPDYILRFSLFNAIFLTLERIIYRYNPLAGWIYFNMIGKALGLGVSYSLLMLIPDNIIYKYSWVVYVLGGVYKSMEFC